MAARPPADGAALVKLAKRFVGSKYTWGGESPKTGFDCSGFAQWLYSRQGVQLRRTTYQQVTQGVSVDVANLKPGDLLFFRPDSAGAPQHEGIYIGNGKFIHAAGRARGVVIDNLSSRSDFITARRVATYVPGSHADTAAATKEQDFATATPPMPARPKLLPVTGAQPTSAQPDLGDTSTPLSTGGVGSPGSADPSATPDFQPVETWQLFAALPMSSPDTARFAQLAAMSQGG